MIADTILGVVTHDSKVEKFSLNTESTTINATMHREYGTIRELVIENREGESQITIDGFDNDAGRSARVSVESTEQSSNSDTAARGTKVAEQ